MFDHVGIRASDREESERFYRTVLPTLGIEPTHTGDHYVEWDDLSVAAASGSSVLQDSPPTRRLHVGFVAPSRDHVDEFWRAGTSAGYRDNGAPGERPVYHAGYYGAFVLDPDGNNIELVNHNR